MTAFGPDGFVFQELDGKLGCRNIHRLAAHGTQMHLHATVLVIDFRQMLKFRNIEIGIQFAIDARQEGSG